MIPQTPEILLTPLVIDGDKSIIPVETPAGTPDFSISSGFPKITSIEKEKGGIAPRRIDFNAVFNLLSIHTYFLQSGGNYTYNPALDYIFGSMVLGSDRALYFCIFPNGPEAGAGITHDPVNSPDYWRMIINADGKLNADNLSVVLGAFATRDNVSLSDDMITGILPISKGGTGAATANNAYSNLGGKALGKLDTIAITDSKITGNLPAARVSGLAKVATSGNYNDLTNKPANTGAPLPNNNAGAVGQWRGLELVYNGGIVNDLKTASAPAGGTWVYFMVTQSITTFNPGDEQASYTTCGSVSFNSGIVAGGTTLFTASSYLRYGGGACWRIQ